MTKRKPKPKPTFDDKLKEILCEIHEEPKKESKE